MKKHPAKRSASRSVKKVKSKAKRVVKRTARRAAKLTGATATKGLAELKHAITALKSKGSSAKGKAAKVEQAFAQATKLNVLVKKMKSAGLI